MVTCVAEKSSDFLLAHNTDEIRLAMQLEARLQRITGRVIRVHICDSELQLFGTAASWYDKQLAQEAARTVVPALRIRNELRVSMVD